MSDKPLLPNAFPLSLEGVIEASAFVGSALRAKNFENLAFGLVPETWFII